MKFLSNAAVDRFGPFPDHPILNAGGLSHAIDVVAGWPGYSPTPLVELPALARGLGVARVMYKDESGRFGIGSFKALGGCFGTSSALAIREGGLQKSNAPHLCCASDGNHGRAVAWAARTIGARATVFVPDACSDQRAAAIGALGSDIIRVRGSYEDALHQSVAAARRNGWILVSDTAFPGCDDVPAFIMSAYQIIARELSERITGLPSHIFVQAGTGGLAAAICAYFWERCGRQRPVFTVVESDAAACLFESAKQGRRVHVDGPHNTAMAGLACGEASTLAWDILATGADAFASISDAEAFQSMQALASGGYGARCFAGESGIAGLCGLSAIAADAVSRKTLGITAESVLVAIGTEGPLAAFVTPAAVKPTDSR